MDMDWIAEKARETLLECKEFPPCLFVEFSQSERCILGLPQFEVVDNARDRAKIAFIAGRTFAKKIQKKYKKSQVAAVYLVSECWYAPATHSREFRRAISHPQRKEGLKLAAIDANTMKQTLRIYEILRNGANIDLLRDTEVVDETMEIQGASLPCFLAGVKTAKQDQSLAIHEFRRTYEKHAAIIQA
jgi:hypothetical protein